MVRFPFLPQDSKFFQLFEESAAKLQTAAHALSELMQDYSDAEAKVKRIKDLESEADTITHQVMAQLHLTFVTPLDREDIALLIQRLDDVIDLIEDAAYTMLLFKIPQPTAKARDLTAVLARISNKVAWAMGLLRQKGKLKDILPLCVKVHDWEEEGDTIFRAALGELFSGTTDPLEVIKWREIYQKLEDACDRGEDVANVLEGIVLKHA